MTNHIFFSWQSDTSNKIGRSLIEDCLKSAIKEMQADAEINPAVREMKVDRDTLGVAGSPPIMETIFGKIDRAAAFVSDLTYVGDRLGGGKTPNPNVCIEHGYALKRLSWRRMISVMNTALGHPDDYDLPFDLRHVRRPILFECLDETATEERTKVKTALTKHLVSALKTIFGDAAAVAEMQTRSAVTPHPHDVELLERVRRQLPVRLQRFLREHDFATAFGAEEIDLTHDMIEGWVGAAFEFENSSLQASFTELRKIARELLTLVALKTHPTDTPGRLQTVMTIEDIRSGMLQPETELIIQELNAKATELSDAIDRFERTARKQVPVASETSDH